MYSWDKLRKLTKQIVYPGRKPGETEIAYRYRMSLWRYKLDNPIDFGKECTIPITFEMLKHFPCDSLPFTKNEEVNE